MKRAVIFCLLINLVLVVKSYDEITLRPDDDFEDDEYVFDENEFGSYGVIDENDVGEEYVDDNDEDDDASWKCLICKAVIDVMLMEIEKVDPKKRIEVTSTKSIQFTKSESYLTDLMEDICEADETFTTIRQIVFQKTVIRQMIRNQGVVEEERTMTENVNHLCLEVLGESEEIFLKEFQKEKISGNIRDIICTQTAQYCDTKNDTKDNIERDEL